MSVDSAGGNAVGSAGPRLIRRVLIAVTMTTAAASVGVLVPALSANAPVIEGTDGDDHLVGTARADDIYGLGGNDEVAAGGGDDDVSAGGGADSVNGGLGNDLIRLGPLELESWVEFANGGPGFDSIEGSGANDHIFGGSGGDGISSSRGDDEITDGDGSDEINAGLGDDLIRLQDGADFALLWTGDDRVIASSDGQRDRINCGPGRDTISWSSRRQMQLDQTSGCEVERVRRTPSDPVPRVVESGR